MKLVILSLLLKTVYFKKNETCYVIFATQDSKSFTFYSYHNSYKKRKDSLEGSLDRVLFAAELEFPKILVPRLPQHTSDVNTECAAKSGWSKQLYSLYVTSFLEH